MEQEGEETNSSKQLIDVTNFEPGSSGTAGSRPQQH